MKSVARLSILLMVAALVGCASPRMTKRQVIEVAIQAAQVDVSRCQRPVAHYWLAATPHTWEVLFRSKVLIPGGDFSVEVDDRSGEAKVMHGL